MKYTLLLIAFTLFCLSVSADDARKTPRFTNAPLKVILDRYTELTGKKVEVVEGVRAQITLQPEKELQTSEWIKFIEQKLREENIGLFPIPTNRLVAAWIDTSKAPSSRPNYRDRLEQRRQEMKESSNQASQAIGAAAPQPKR